MFIKYIRILSKIFLSREKSMKKCVRVCVLKCSLRISIMCDMKQNLKRMTGQKKKNLFPCTRHGNTSHFFGKARLPSRVSWELIFGPLGALPQNPRAAGLQKGAGGLGTQRSFPCLPPEQSWLFLVPRGVNRVRSTCLPKQQVGTWLQCAPKTGCARARRGSTWSVATSCST